MFSRKLFPDTGLGEDTKIFTSRDFTLCQYTFCHGFLLFFLSLFFLCQAEMFTPIRDCSVNTELIYRMNDSEQEFCV